MTLIDRSLRWVTAVGCLSFVFVGTAVAEDFGEPCGTSGPPCDDHTTSLGSYVIHVDCRYQLMMVGCPPYNPGDPGAGGWHLISRNLYSPTLYDPATVIGRSAPHGDATVTDESTGAVVGTAGTNIKDSDFSVVPAGFEGPAGTREVHTEIVHLRMTDLDGTTTAEVRAGAPSFGLRLSPGEVESLSTSGLPANDFPAESFFDVYVEVDLPCGALAGATVYNRAPLVVMNDNLPDPPGFPPRVVYIHGETEAVPVYFTADDPGTPPLWRKDDRFGWLVLAGHGVGFGEGEEYDYWWEYENMSPDEMTVPIASTGACCFPEVEGHPCVEDMTYQACCDDPQGGYYHGDGTQCGAVVACCFDQGSCEDLHEVCCADGRAGEPSATSPTCLGDGDGNGRDDACEAEPIPTVSEWGLVVLVALVLTAGAVVVWRRRTVSA